MVFNFRMDYNELMKKHLWLFILVVSLFGSVSNAANIPANAYESHDFWGWKCNPGYYSPGRDSNLCLKLPPNSYTEVYIEGFLCNKGYVQVYASKTCEINTGSNNTSKNESKKVTIPPNAYADNTTVGGWECNSGYYRNNTNTCSKLPANASPQPYYQSGPSFQCNSGYYRDNNACSKLPPNSGAYSYGDGFYCTSGYKKSWGSCIKENETKKPETKTEEPKTKIAEPKKVIDDGRTIKSSFRQWLCCYFRWLCCNQLSRH